MTPLQFLSARWPEIDALLDQALALPPAQWPGWLDALTGESAALRETLSLLLQAQAGTDDGFLAVLPQLPVSAAPGDDPAPGDQVGPYRLIEPLGRGGMGLVWHAERTDGRLRRAVALKLPRLAWGGATAERLARERDILAALDHPHIARLLDAGVDDQGRPFLALERVQGQAIDQYCAAQALDVPARLALLLQVAAAVAHAHGRLVVHRDLKPANILVTADGQVRLLDFGIAKLLEGDHTQETALTRLAGAALTPDYASPEQIRGEPLGVASDVYSLAVVAYELLAGVRPYRLKRGSAAELEEAIASADVPLASSMAASPALRRALRGDLDAILNQALKKTVAERTASADAFAQDIERHLRGEPVLARPDGRRYRLGKFLRRHRVGVAMGSTVALAVAAGSGVAIWQALAARAEAERASAEVTRQEAVRNLYIDVMTRLSVLGRDDAAALAAPGAVHRVLREELDAYARRYQRLPGAVQAQLEAVTLQLNYGNDFAGSLEVGQRYLAHLKQHGAEPALVINAHAMLGGTLFQLRRLDESLAMRRAGVAWSPQADDDRTASARLLLSRDLGNMLSARGLRSEARTVLANAEALAQRRFPNSLFQVKTLQAVAGFHATFDDQRALHYARLAQAAQEAASTADDATREHGLFILGGALLGVGQPGDAVPALREGLALNIKLYGKTDRNTVRAIGRLAAALARSGGLSEAQALLDEALQQQPVSAGAAPTPNRLLLQARQLELAWLRGDAAGAVDLLASDPADHLRWLASRGGDLFLSLEVRALLLAGRPADALARAQRLHRDWRDRDLPSAAWLRILETLALAQLGAGDTAAARTTAGRLLAMLAAEQARGSWAWRSANTLAGLAAARSGDGATALQYLAAADAVTAVAPSAVERADAMLLRAQALVLAGRPDEARRAARSVLASLPGQHSASPRLALARRLADG